MAKVKRARREKRHPFKNLSLKWSFGLYTLGCLAVALAVSLMVTVVCSGMQSEMYTYYENLYQEEVTQPGELSVNGEVVNRFTVYTNSIYDYFTPRDRKRYEICSQLTVLSYPLAFGLSIALSGVVFYRRKLKGPLTELNRASQRIAAGDLDFSIQGKNKNEMGRLLDSFEVMRSALLENNRSLFRMMEERKSVQAAFAHDLRTPLTILRGYNDYLRKYYPKRLTEEKVLSTLSTMDGHIARLENYVALMGRLNKLEEVEPRPEKVSLPELQEKLKMAGEMLCGAKAFRMRGECAGTREMDVSLVEQVFENFVNNAIRHARTEVVCDLSVQGNFLRLTVEDDGSGFSPEAIKRAAEPYFRDEARDGEHFGLGLYICRVLAEKHGGALGVSNGEKGARVSAIFRFFA